MLSLRKPKSALQSFMILCRLASISLGIASTFSSCGLVDNPDGGGAGKKKEKPEGDNNTSGRKPDIQTTNGGEPQFHPQEQISSGGGGEVQKPAAYGSGGGEGGAVTNNKFTYPKGKNNVISKRDIGFLKGGMYILKKGLYRLGYESTEQTAFFESNEYGKLLVTTLKDGNICILTMKFRAPRQKGQLGNPETQTITVEGNLSNIYSIRIQSSISLTANEFDAWAENNVIAYLMMPEFQQDHIEEL